MTPGIIVARDGAIATVALSNPDKLNALTVAMWRELTRAMNTLSADETLRCIVLRGAGEKAFAAGADIEEVRATARHIVEGAPLVNRWHKQFVRRLAPQPAPPTDAEIEENFAYFNTEDYRRGMQAFLNKKKPKFVGR